MRWRRKPHRPISDYSDSELRSMWAVGTTWERDAAGNITVIEYHAPEQTPCPPHLSWRTGRWAYYEQRE